jgi:hypothetical protein
VRPTVWDHVIGLQDGIGYLLYRIQTNTKADSTLLGVALFLQCLCIWILLLCFVSLYYNYKLVSLVVLAEVPFLSRAVMITFLMD